MPTHKKYWIKCSECNEKLERASTTIQKHYKTFHNKAITEAEAYKIINPRKGNKALYTEGLARNYIEVSGGLPSLGKRK